MLPFAVDSILAASDGEKCLGPSRARTPDEPDRRTTPLTIPRSAPEGAAEE